MDISTKRAQLQRLLDQAETITVHDSDDPKFKTWKNLVERTLHRVFGADSPEIKQFQELRFFYSAMVMTLGSDYSREHRECFDRDFEILVSSIRSYIDELGPEESISTPENTGQQGTTRKIFISHASSDVDLAEEMVDFLEVIGVPQQAIFCSSLVGYGISLGENFLEAIKTELVGNTLVIFLLTPKFFSSPVSLCEMGAVWIRATDHIPVVVPPLDFSDIKGVIPLSQGMKINDPLQLNQFKQKIETAFSLEATIGQSAWERKRDRALARINKSIEVLSSRPVGT